MGIKEFEMYIFNRWGEQLFFTDDINIGWDGTYNGALVEQGIYVYKVKAKTYKNVYYNKTGVVSLLKAK